MHINLRLQLLHHFDSSCWKSTLQHFYTYSMYCNLPVNSCSYYNTCSKQKGAATKQGRLMHKGGHETFVEYQAVASI